MAAPLIVYATRTWADGVEEVTRMQIAQELEIQSDPSHDGTQPCQPEPHPPPPEDYGCLAVDSKNAYGSMLRSTMLRAARLRVPRLANMRIVAVSPRWQLRAKVENLPLFFAYSSHKC